MMRLASTAFLLVFSSGQDLFLSLDKPAQHAANHECAKTGDEQACSFAKGWREIAADNVQQPASSAPKPRLTPAVGYFMRNLTVNAGFTVKIPGAPAWLESQTIYRIAPGGFPDYMHYHYDGFAMPMRFRFGADGTLTMKSKPYESKGYTNMSECYWTIFSGTGPIVHPLAKDEPPYTDCMVNPAVNPFPFNGQLWLTIDNAFWGRVDPETLDTIPTGPAGSVQIDSSVMTAHPACDHETNECFTNYPCEMNQGSLKTLSAMWSDEICMGKFVTDGLKSMKVVEVSRVKLPYKLFVHHSHEPCMSKNFVIVKMDHFKLKTPDFRNQGMLRFVNQEMDNLWLLYDRRTNASRILHSGDFKLINNHFLNCFEVDDEIIVDTSPSTDVYLDNYFEYNLHEQDRKWDKIMLPAHRCKIPTDPSAVSFSCEKLFTSGDWQGLFDFPTFNPLYKSNPDTNWFYATAPIDNKALWMNSVIKGDVKQRKVVATWSEPGVYTTEANFIPRPGATEEDDGVLFSLMYDSKIDSSIVVLLDAKTLKLIGKTDLGMVIPYHSHGVLCQADGRCFPNP